MEEKFREQHKDDRQTELDSLRSYADEKRFYDSLTGLPNMHRFLELAAARIVEIKASGKHPCTLSFNLNGMKSFNSRYGIVRGNELLCAFADMLARQFGHECCSRFGEDHFYAITEDETHEEILKEIFEDLKHLNGGTTTTVRVGAFNEPAPGTRISTACDRARLACDLDKRGYESRVVYYDASMGLAQENRDYIINNLDRALEEGHIKVWYQPVIRTMDGKLCGTEALARWIDPDRGYISPGDFVPVLEENNLTYKLDTYVVQRIAREMKEHISRGIQQVPVSFNLSRTDFLTSDPFTILEKAVSENELQREYFRVEITETTLMSEPDAIRREIERFHGCGYEVLMDDFGSGYSSLNTLKDFDFDEIKIDMAFMRNFNHKSMEIVRSIIGMAKRLGIHTLAEGVESEEQVEFLRDVGCEKIQGFYYGKPVHPDAFMYNISEKGILPESPEDRLLYGPAGLADIMKDIPLALFMYDGRRFEMCMSNGTSRKIAVAGERSLKKSVETMMNTPYNELSSRLKDLAGRAMKSSERCSMTFVLMNRYYRVALRDLSRCGNRHIIEGTLQDITFDDKEKETEDLDQVARNVLSVYTCMYLLDTVEDTMTVISSIREGERAGMKYNGLDMVLSDSGYFKNIYPDDHDRYLDFIDLKRIVGFLRSKGRGNCSDIFRSRLSGGDYIWTEYSIIALPGMELTRFLLCLKPIYDRDLARMRGLASSVLENSYENGRGSDDESTVSESDLQKELWKTIVTRSPLKLFWKDRNRRFLGASEGFLRYYGYRSADEIIGKTDEDIGWNLKEQIFTANEEKVINEGDIIIDEMGECVVNGKVRAISYSKLPYYNDGRIQGLIGYFTDAERTLTGITDHRKKDLIDPLTGFLNADGVLHTILKYDSDRRLENRNYTLAMISVPIYDEMYRSYGAETADTLIVQVAGLMREIFNSGAAIGRPQNSRFVVYQHNLSYQEMKQKLLMLYARMKKIHDVDGKPCTVYINFGIAMSSEVENTSELFTLVNRRVDEYETRNRDIDDNDAYAMELDLFSDLPSPYVVLKAIRGQTGDTVVDMQYVYVNRQYCEYTGTDRTELIGKSLFQMRPHAYHSWLRYCGMAALEGKTISDVVLNEADGHWMGFTFAPVSIEGCCSFSFVPIRESEESRELLSKRWSTDDRIVRITDLLNRHEEYETIMDNVLAELGKTLRPDRVHVMVIDEGGRFMDIRHEWCAKGIKPQNSILSRIDYGVTSAFWNRMLEADNCIELRDINVIMDHDMKLYNMLRENAVDRFLSVPLYSNEKLIGLLEVDNYVTEENIDARRLMKTVASFLSSTITNHMLMTTLEHLGNHDALTGVHNRNAVMERQAELIRMNGDEGVGIIFTDVNGLKKANDEFGHEAGDQLLRFAADMLTGLFDLENVYRTGGDEFVVILSPISERDFREKFTELRRAMEEETRVSMAAGCAWSRRTEDVEKLVYDADNRMYADKAEYYMRHDRRN